MKRAENKRQWFCMCYDEAARKSWAERSYANDPKLNLEVKINCMCTLILDLHYKICPSKAEADVVNASIVERALAKYDAIEKVCGIDIL